MEVLMVGSCEELLMECDGEDQKGWPQTPGGDEEEEDEHDEAEEAPDSLEEEEEEEEEEQEKLISVDGEESLPPQLIRVIPIPTASSLPPHNNTVKPSEAWPRAPGAPLGFMVNGQPVTFCPGGDGAELKLQSCPGGSVSGFTALQLPTTLTIRGPTGLPSSNPLASLRASVSPFPPEPGADLIPIITDVMCGEAAEKVLSNCITKPKSQTQSLTQSLTSASTSRAAAPPKPLNRGSAGSVLPADCPVCGAQFQISNKLRGFMCECSTEIAQSLMHIAKLTHHRRSWSRDSKPSRSPRDPKCPAKGSKSKAVFPGQRTSHKRLSDQSPTSSSQDTQLGPPPDPPHSKLVILVEDFYYGTDDGRRSAYAGPPVEKVIGPYHCIHCPKTLRNNIKLMSHMKLHAKVTTQQDGEMDTSTSCQHCYRPFFSPFSLQCHLEAVHSYCESTTKCKICELAFENEPTFLQHMKSTHSPGEMPYVCQVCDYRSSFYSLVVSHFQEVHANTNNLLCLYCLKVTRSSFAYQQHFAKHQRKSVCGCDQCRLHFLSAKDRSDHKVQHHKTHIRPPQLNGLKTGTTVTVRTYSVVRPAEREETMKRETSPCQVPVRTFSVVRPAEREETMKKETPPCQVIDVPPGTPPQDAPKRKPVESLGPLLSNVNQQSDDGWTEKQPSCVECLSSISDFTSHFPTLVHCSVCKYLTCCCRAYANHMINNHVTRRSNTQYLAMYQSYPRLVKRLRCVSCRFSTSTGDMMANHLIDHPEHHGSIFTQNELVADVPERAAGQSIPSPHSLSASVSGRRGGAFIPIHLLPSGTSSAQLSIKPLTSPSRLSSTPAMSIKFLGPRPQPEEDVDWVMPRAPALPRMPRSSPHPPSALSLDQLKVVLSSLCNGLSQAAQCYRTPPLTIQAWTQQEQQGVEGARPGTDHIAEWVLRQREQQLTVSEDTLLQTAVEALGEDSKVVACYRWAVDFMLHHNLGLQSSISTGRRRLPHSIQERTRCFTRFLHSQVQSKNLQPSSIGAMDELSIFINPHEFSAQKLSAFRLSGTSEDPLFDIVLSGLADGTFLTPVLLFRGQPPDIPQGFPDNVWLEARPEGFTDEQRLTIWLDKVWRPHVTVQNRGQGLLIVDTHRGHLKDAFLTGLHAHTVPAVIPTGCSCRLQPLDVCVTPSVREFLQARWSQLLSQGGGEALGLDQLALTLACWLSEVASTLSTRSHILRRSFTVVSTPPHEEKEEGLSEMIQDLTEALIPPLEVDGHTEEPIEMLFVIEEQQQEVEVELEEDEVEQQEVEVELEEDEVEQQEEGLEQEGAGQ